MHYILSLIVLVTLAVSSTSFRVSFPTFINSVTSLTSLSSAQSRRDFFNDSKNFAKNFALTSSSFVSLAFLNPSPSSASEEEAVAAGVSISKSKEGTGPTPSVGELAAIRFKARCGQTTIDDIYGTPEPFYTRVGSGGLIKGVEMVLPSMRVGDRWVLTIPGSLAFGKKGRPASAGKPRIPADAEIVFDVEVVGLPGREEELIELIGDV
mmetsp:Transcript_6743/g.14017  ORF Transcript_6743/g.14017 Transcript_6743/m.14017 type:complete len:209 (+) Transcript_6743:35-661(+)